MTNHEGISMKNIKAILLLAAGLLLLSGCQQQQQSGNTGVQSISQSYRGILPCADCGGVDTLLSLEQDGTFVLQETYLATRDGNKTFASQGNWVRTGDQLLLSVANGERRYFRQMGSGLRMLDQQGNAITSSLNYTLLPVSAPSLETPMPLTGLYTYMADAAVFKDCATGRTFPVENNLALQQGYMQARKAPGEPVFLKINGSFRVRPSMEPGLMQKMMVPEPNGEFTFDSRKNCAN
jgi:copper homeostasis protein (lipoprotein)